MSSCSFAPFFFFFFLNSAPNSGLQPLIDQTPLVLYSSASEILLSAAMIYDAISRGGLDWLPPLPPLFQGRGAHSVATNVKPDTEGVFFVSLSPSLSKFFHYNLVFGWKTELGFRPDCRCVLEQKVKKGTFVRQLLVCITHVRLN